MSIRIEDLAKTDFRSVTAARCTGKACQKAREDQAIVGSLGGESIISTIAGNCGALDVPDEEAPPPAQFVKRGPVMMLASYWAFTGVWRREGS